MGNTLPLARSEDSRLPNRHARAHRELLDEGRSGVSSHTSLRRNKRKKATPTSKRTKGSSAKDTPTKSPVSAKVKDLDGGTSKRKGHRHSNKNRQPDRGAEGEDRTLRRSASELGIEWIGDFCPDGQPHRLIGKHNFDGGSLLKCAYCQKHIWLPTLINDASTLDSMIDYLGPQAGYCKFLDKHQEAKVMVAKLQDLWYAKQGITDSDKFMSLVISVMEDKEYDRIKEVSIER